MPADNRPNLHSPTTAYILLLLLSIGDVGLVGLRGAYSGNSNYWFLVWNLFLAWLPLAFALLAAAAWKQGNTWSAACCSGLWLLFFPNAPYILTDLVHLRHLPPVPLWYDMLMLLAFAWTGLLLGFASLYIIHRLVRAGAGRGAGWVVALGSLVLGSFGIYLGRFLRWNSWDVFTRPVSLLARLTDGATRPQEHLRVVVVTMLLSGFLALTYLVMFHLNHLSADDSAP